MQYSRPAFCYKCFIAKRPQAEDYCFIAVPEEKDFYIKRKFSEIQSYFLPPTRGFTPHTYRLEHFAYGVVTYTLSCGICEVICKQSGPNIFVCVSKASTPKTIPLNKWNRMYQQAIILNSK